MPKVTKGRLYTAGKNKYYYLRYVVNGKDIRRVLHDENGEPVTKQRDAERIAAIIMQPFTVKEQAARMEQIQVAAEGAAAKAARVEAKAAELEAKEEERRKERLASIENAWELFMQCPKRPKSCKAFPADAIPKHTTAANYRGYYRHFSEWLAAKRPKVVSVSQVTPNDALAFMRGLEKEASSGTFNKYLQFLQCFYRTLTEAGKITCQNPFQDIDRAEQAYNSKSPLSVEQIQRLLDAAEGELKTLIALGIGTGLRLGDCCTLRWSEVDLARGTIERIPHKTAHTVKDRTQAIVKVGIPRFLSELLLAAPNSGRGLYVLPETAGEYLRGSEVVFRQIQALFQKCEIQTVRTGTGAGTGTRAVVEYGFHSLRYSYITFHAEHGTPQAVIQRNAGHSNPAMTAHYEKISDEAARKYAEVIDVTPIDAGDAGDAGDDAQDADRARLIELAKTLPIDKVKALLSALEG